MLEQLIPFLTASAILTISPGPDIFYVMVQGMVNGKKHGFVTALGLATGIIINTSLVAFGVSVIIKNSDTLFFIIKLFGAIYLLYLAWQVFKTDPEIAYSAEGIKEKSLFSLFKQGFIMNVLNPKVTIFFLAFFPGFLWEPNGNTVIQFYILGAFFMLLTILIFGSVALLAGKISNYLKRHKHSGVVLKWLQIVVFVGIASFILI
ncbi:LysE family translocator [Salegentibacter salarius]|uniref:Lysine transporter LysE n=1 Tax=Salegentibacter salarius TaxID=435906 RepID=A0A2N0U088_9FLAO|nr:LysE family translocator [Salegentibacter salarius]OEY73387.1 lysine transporter LysE [Salegentibacter salarius]PKD20308.1 lysine transporter LysE [Salegentibacter salarius]SLJ97000.1 Threonine/homoserine/homoserine lactone efflux protein [Salegentibacter salarius]